MIVNIQLLVEESNGARDQNLKKFRGKKKALHTTGYGSVQRRTYHVESFTSEGISETCNTEHVVSEDEEDTRYLHRKNYIQCEYNFDGSL